MSICKVIQEVKGQRAIDGAGVHLVRVLGNKNVQEFDPFLMLDSFDSKEPSDYTAGFPMHPHRGIETITYLISGEIEHKDSLGNRGTIGPGEAQWMTAGSGILHEEMPLAAERMLGFQLWLNLSREEKMSEPRYLSIGDEQIGETQVGQAQVRVLSGSFQEATGVTPNHLPVSIYDVTLPKGADISIPVKSGERAFVFLIEGDGYMDGSRISSKTAVLFGSGDEVLVTAPAESDSRFIFFSGKPLEEPIAWGGPIVMNTREELNKAFEELEQGTFIK
ncbi:pirin family protein [Aminipila butyrica]|uniref:Pirin family protein n=1 Tax=Aminipila butyrica TaxID=433296 RepID=A0A858BUT1_9FIRM|nr:pirin family protein [Aminipila butyrica]QIB69347.1 pirin family protein [Aminipila butyrica]